MGAQSRRLWLNALLLLVVGALALFVWLKNNAQEEQVNSVLFSLTANEVERVTIQRGLDNVEVDLLNFERQGKHWFVSSLTQTPLQAGQVKMAQLFTLLSDPISQRYSAEGRDLSDYALDPGYVRVAFNNEEVILGDANPVSQQRYMLKDNELLLASETVFGLLNSPLETWLSNFLVPPQYKIKQLTYANGKQAPYKVIQNWQSSSGIELKKVTEFQRDNPITLILDNDETLIFFKQKSDEDLLFVNAKTKIQYMLPLSQVSDLLDEEE